MRRLTITLGVLCLGQLWGTAVAIAVAATEIESIVVTGPTFTVLGLLVVLLGAIDGRMMAVWFGLSAGLVSLLVFVLINAMGWGPDPAATPVTLILLSYELAVIPIGLLALYDIVSRPRLTPSQIPRQFNLRSLLVLMLLAGVDLAIVRLAMHQGTTTLAVIAVGLGAAAFLASVVVVVLAFHRRAAEPAPS